ncbi:hypothetical protein ACQCN2_11705 [Brevibacillus ginsengisoli]|uniref:hypothetical protein n=1 Tax=Brevibacillus ginsengisoli TaxID=363854 RepID=UPI003CFA7847
MNNITTIFAIALADFFERIRRTNFYILIAFTLLLGYFFVPPKEASYLTLDLGGTRGIYNSAWIGSMTAVLSNIAISLIGFYAVKNSVERDELTKTGQLIASSPISNFQYTLGKTTSNFMLLLFLTFFLMIAAAVMQQIRGEDHSLQLWPLLSPFLFLTVPLLASVSALAILFEMVGFLKGVTGNVVYFFLWIGSMLISHFTTPSLPIDPLALTIPLSSMNVSGTGTGSIGIIEVTGLPKTFLWNGIDWSVGMIAARVAWLLPAILLVLCGSLLFQRFDQNRVRHTAKRKKQKLPSLSEREAVKNEQPSPIRTTVTLTPLLSYGNGFRFVQLLCYELKILYKGMPLYWYAIQLALIFCCLILSSDIALRWFVPLSMIWSMPIWAKMGSQAKIHKVTEIIHSSSRFPVSHTVLVWGCGIIVSLFATSGMLLSSAFSLNWYTLFSLLASACFISGLAIILGTYIGNSRPFEIIFLLVWYLGPINQLSYFDFIGSTPKANELGIPFWFALFADMLLLLHLLKLKGTQKRRSLFQ